MPPSAAVSYDPAAVEAALHRHFGFRELRPGQEAALRPVVEGRDTLVVMPTGAGKSLIYQLGALLQPEGVTVVVSPLIALMKDQVDALNARGIPAVAINSSQSASERREALSDVRAGRARLVYAAPERLRLSSFQQFLRDVGVALLAVDEAHCVSQWGHDFRPDYLAVGAAREAIGHPPCVALTATGTPRVQDDICQQLGLDAPVRLVTGFDRPNLRLVVRSTPTVKEKRQALRRFLTEHAGEAGLIYVSTRKEAEDLSRFVRDEAGLPCETYHAGLLDIERSDVQERFIRGDLGLVVATNAFGMGVDRADVRFVAHWSIPPTVEAYYQEAGRAGRDGEPATVVLFYAPQDRSLREWFIEQQAPALEDLRALHRTLQRRAEDGVARGEPDEVAEAAERHPVGGRVAISILERAGLAERLDGEGTVRAWEVRAWDEHTARRALRTSDAHRDAKQKDLAGIIGYAQTGECRRRLILDHFGDPAETHVPPEQCCDACAARARLKDAPDEIPEWDALPMASRVALGLLDAVRRMRWPVGRMTMAKILAGSGAKGMDRYTNHPYYGKLQHLGQAEIDRAYKQLMLGGYLRIGGGEYPIVELTPVGNQALDHREAIEIAIAAGTRSTASSSSASSDEPLAPKDAALFETLRAWRTEQARERAVPPYVVFNDRTLRALAEARPQTDEALLAVSGVGPAKAEAYGADVLALIAEA